MIDLQHVPPSGADDAFIRFHTCEVFCPADWLRYATGITGALCVAARTPIPDGFSLTSQRLCRPCTACSLDSREQPDQKAGAA